MAAWEEILQSALKTAAVAFVGSIVGQVASEVLPQQSQLPQLSPTNEVKNSSKSGIED